MSRMLVTPLTMDNRKWSMASERVWTCASAADQRRPMTGTMQNDAGGQALEVGNSRESNLPGSGENRLRGHPAVHAVALPI